MSVKNFLLMTGVMLPRKVVYKDPLNNCIYYCDAEHWALKTEPKRRVTKWILEDWDIVEVLETDWYNNAVPDRTAVQALNYY